MNKKVKEGFMDFFSSKASKEKARQEKAAADLRAKMRAAGYTVFDKASQEEFLNDPTAHQAEIDNDIAQNAARKANTEKYLKAAADKRREDAYWDARDRSPEAQASRDAAADYKEKYASTPAGKYKAAYDADREPWRLRPQDAERWGGGRRMAEEVGGAPQIQFPDWLKQKLQRVHGQPGQGSVFAKPIDEVENIVKNIISKTPNIAEIASGAGTIPAKVPGVGYDLVKPTEQLANLQVVSKETVEKEEGKGTIQVPAVKVADGLDKFKTDDLTIVVRPMKDDAGNVLPNQYIILSAYPGNPNIPRASEWGGKYAVVIPNIQVQKESKMKITKEYLRAVILEELQEMRKFSPGSAQKKKNWSDANKAMAKDIYLSRKEKEAKEKKDTEDKKEKESDESSED